VFVPKEERKIAREKTAEIMKEIKRGGLAHGFI
jgi:hypothetical protein